MRSARGSLTTLGGYALTQILAAHTAEHLLNMVLLISFAIILLTQGDLIKPELTVLAFIPTKMSAAR
jgi:hypothetical protein